MTKTPNRKARAREKVATGQLEARELRILCLRGQRNTDEIQGHVQDSELKWLTEWIEAIQAEYSFWNTPTKIVDRKAVGFDEILEKQKGVEPSRQSITLALRHTLWKSVMSVGPAPANAHLAASHAWRNLNEKTRWQAGLLAQWAENTTGQNQMREKVVSAIEEFQPNIVCAHGLTCLAVYDALIRPEQQGLGKDLTLITITSPLGNPVVRSVFGGRLMMLPVKWWFNLTNPAEDSLSAPLQTVSTASGSASGGKRRRSKSAPEQQAANFRELLTPFRTTSDEDPSPQQYLQHQNVRFGMWRILAGTSPMPYDLSSQDAWSQMVEEKPSSAAVSAGAVSGKRRVAPPAKEDWKALVIGINDYPNPAHQLSGCVNDAYLVSRFLQNRGFESGDIRLLLNERATASQIRDRLEWLLRDAPPKSTRVLYYSGHGAQIASYGLGEKIDTLDECLVPYDFDWSIEKAVTDDWFYDLYSQLSYDVNFVAFFDCCHSGGISRNGVRQRGLNPPADVLHREMEWSSAKQRWERKTKKLAKKDLQKDDLQLRKIGKAAPLRTNLTRLGKKHFAERYGHQGPYKPIIFKACGEDESAEEIHEGSVTYGVFTYALASVLKALPDQPPEVLPKAFHAHALVEKVRAKIKEIRFPQEPSVEGPNHILSAPLKMGRDMS